MSDTGSLQLTFQSNGRAEATVKSIKRILIGNINPSTGALDTDSAARAIMIQRNTPAQDTGFTPSVMLFGKPLKATSHNRTDNYDRNGTKMGLKMGARWEQTGAKMEPSLGGFRDSWEPTSYRLRTSSTK